METESRLNIKDQLASSNYFPLR